eukprot:gene9267-biopygen11892
MRPWRTSPPRAAHVAGPSDERAQYVGQAGLSKPRGLAGVAHALLDKTQREGAVFAGQDSAGSSRLSAVGDHAGDLARQSLCRAERFNAGLPKAQAHPRSTRPPFPSPRMEQVVRPSWHSAALLASHAAFAAAALGRRAEARRQLGCGSCGLNRGHAGGPANLLNLPHSGHLKMPGLRKVGEGVSGTDAAPVSAHDPSHESLTLEEDHVEKRYPRILVIIVPAGRRPGVLDHSETEMSECRTCRESIDAGTRIQLSGNGRVRGIS